MRSMARTMDICEKCSEIRASSITFRRMYGNGDHATIRTSSMTYNYKSGNRIIIVLTISTCNRSHVILGKCYNSSISGSLGITRVISVITKTKWGLHIQSKELPFDIH